MSSFKPQKAPSQSLTEADLDSLAYPILGSPKIDALRGVGFGGGIRSKTLRPFRNTYINRLFEDSRCGGLDGELVVGAPFGHDVLRRSMSGITSAAGSPLVTWHVFDDFSHPMYPYEERLKGLALRLRALPAALRDKVALVEQVLLKNKQEILRLEKLWLSNGYEGMMLRSPKAFYKFGRATVKEGIIYKFKRFEDAEAVAVEFREGTINENEARKKPDGSTVRSTSKSGKRPSGLLGTIVGLRPDGSKIEVGAGEMTNEERRHVLLHKEDYLHRSFNYKHFPYGAGEVPRHGTFRAWVPSDL